MAGGNYRYLTGDVGHGSFYSNPGKTNFPIDAGVFVDYGLNESMGLKMNLFYNQSFNDIGFDGIYSARSGFTIAALNFQLLFKYDVNQEYNKGFYLLAGPRLSFVMETPHELMIEGMYKDSNLGMGLGFGTAFSKAVGFEIIGDYGFSNYLTTDEAKMHSFGAYFNLYLNIASFVNN